MNNIYCIKDEYNNIKYILANNIDNAIKKYYGLPKKDDDERIIKSIECIIKGVLI